ncbi:MAG TPA: endonuclease/exonuclease/phosphatase family protein [Herpetosiphonaceae bacterium]|nr:endonuclease/exonuclease/phosphatase family protein [Herpetosiphonaceae bacterium]
MPRNLRPTLMSLASCYPLLLLGLSAVQKLRPRRRGLLALSSVFAPYLFFPLVLLLPAARRRDARFLHTGLLACAAVYLARFTPPLHVRPRRPMPGARHFSVLTWNVLYRNPRIAELRGFLATVPAEVVALHEVTPALADLIANDSTLARGYPHQILCPYNRGSGLALLSRYPILEHSSIDQPPALRVRLDLGAGQTVTIVSAHPTFGDPRNLRPIPARDNLLMAQLRRIVDPRFLRYDPSHRDLGIAYVRALVEPLLRQSESLVLVGDFNVTEREPAYRELTAGLQDAHRRAGFGSGHTWRPEWMANLPFGLLRIDYLLSTPDLRPLHASVDCMPRGSDHFIVQAEFELM